MNLGQAVNKLSLTPISGLNHTTGLWELLPFKCSYPPDGRFIGRSVSFYDRRTLITPGDIDSKYSLVRVGDGSDSEILMIYASQKNINRNKTYLYSHTGFNVQGYAGIHRLTKTQSASGLAGTAVNNLIGTYPVALEKGFAGPADAHAAGVYNTRVSGYIAAYADIKTSDTLTLAGDTYVIDEMIPELKLLFLQLTKR